MIWITLIVLGLIVSLACLSISLVFWVLVALFVLFLIIWIVIGFHKVQQDQFFVIESNGRYCRTESPGLNFRIPGTECIRARANSAIHLFDLAIPEGKIVFQEGREVIIKGAKAYFSLVRPELVAYIDAEGRNQHPVWRSVYLGKWKDNCIGAVGGGLLNFLRELGFIANRMNDGVPTSVINMAPVTMDALTRFGYQNQNLVIGKDVADGNLYGFFSSVMSNGGTPTPLETICPGVAEFIRQFGFKATVVIDFQEE